MNFLHGMLWYDGETKKSLSQKIAEALTYYVQKYKNIPTIVFVNYQDYKDEKIDGVQVRPIATVFRNHVIVGVQE